MSETPATDKSACRTVNWNSVGLLVQELDDIQALLARHGWDTDYYTLPEIIQMLLEHKPLDYGPYSEGAPLPLSGPQTPNPPPIEHQP